MRTEEEKKQLQYPQDENYTPAKKGFDSEHPDSYNDNYKDGYYEEYGYHEDPAAQFSAVYPKKIIALSVACKTCKSLFPSNNRLYSHLRLDKCKEAKRLLKEVFIISVSAYPAVLTDISATVRIVKSFSDVSKDTGTGYGFRNWHYIITGVKLRHDSSVKQVCLNTGCSLILVDRAWLFQQTLNTAIRRMALLFTVRGIGTDKHATADYAILNIIIPGLDHENKPVEAVITRKAYIVKGLKAKMLIGVNVMGPKKINISMTKKTAYLGFCNVDILIFTKPHARNPVSRVIHVKFTVDIPPYLTISLPVHHI